MPLYGHAKTFVRTSTSGVLWRQEVSLTVVFLQGYQQSIASIYGPGPGIVSAATYVTDISSASGFQRT